MKMLYQGLISAFLIVVIGVQFAASFGGIHPTRYWPFLNYPMYCTPHHAGDVVPVYTLTGILENGTEIAIPDRELNLSVFQMLAGPVKAIHANDREGLLRYLADWEKRQAARLKAVRLENRGVGLSRDGTFAAPPEIKVIDLTGRPS